MASIISLLSEEQFQCSICLNVFTDPVTTPCGHNFCNICITHHWDTNNVCQCPLCKETFDERPRVSINKTLSEMAHQFWRSKHNPSAIMEAEDVFCHFCTETKVKAERSCWTCRRSYCEDHLLRHDFMTEFLPHRLLIAGKNLKDYVCEKHDKHLVMFCKTDHICVCESCGKSSHRSHEVVSVKDEYDEMKAELDKTEAKVKQMIQERQEKIQEVKNSVELSKKAADREIADSEQVFAAMISCIERSQAELIDVIEKEQKTTETQAEDLIKELQQELTVLKKRSSELKQLSHTEDHLHLFEKFRHINTPPPTKDWTKVNVHQPSYWGAVKTAAAQLEETLSQELKKLCDELRSIQKYAVDVTLDPDTAHRRLGLTQDGKEVHNDNMKRNLPGNAVRFTTCFSVLGKEGFSSGRFYCEVQAKDKTEWYLGVVRGSVDRKREITPRDYWTLRLRNGNECHAIAYPNVSVPVREKLQTVGVFVDYEEGLVSFYDVEARVHLYSFTGCTFADKLYPVFNPGPYYAGQNAAPLIISPVG